MGHVSLCPAHLMVNWTGLDDVVGTRLSHSFHSFFWSFRGVIFPSNPKFPMYDGAATNARRKELSERKGGD
jgi:hypothetical protein